MIQVTVGTTTQRAVHNYPADTTIRSILDDNGVDYSSSQVMLDGANLGTGNIDKTLADMNVREKCMLIAVQKANNA